MTFFTNSILILCLIWLSVYFLDYYLNYFVWGRIAFGSTFGNNVDGDVVFKGVILPKLVLLLFYEILWVSLLFLAANLMDLYLMQVILRIQV